MRKRWLIVERLRQHRQQLFERRVVVVVHGGLDYRFDAMVDGCLRSGVNGEALPATFGRSATFLPTFVTFPNPAEFKSVKIAPPGLFDEMFGVGYKLRNVSIEMTDEPVTEEIAKKLPWLPHPGYFNGHVGCGPGDPTYCLHGGHFMRSN
jgi:hypothetical protein